MAAGSAKNLSRNERQGQYRQQCNLKSGVWSCHILQR